MNVCISYVHMICIFCSHFPSHGFHIFQTGARWSNCLTWAWAVRASRRKRKSAVTSSVGVRRIPGYFSRNHHEIVDEVNRVRCCSYVRELLFNTACSRFYEGEIFGSVLGGPQLDEIWPLVHLVSRLVFATCDKCIRN